MFTNRHPGPTEYRPICGILLIILPNPTILLYPTTISYYSDIQKDTPSGPIGIARGGVGAQQPRRGPPERGPRLVREDGLQDALVVRASELRRSTGEGDQKGASNS